MRSSHSLSRPVILGLTSVVLCTLLSEFIVLYTRSVSAEKSAAVKSGRAAIVQIVRSGLDRPVRIDFDVRSGDVILLDQKGFGRHSQARDERDLGFYAPDPSSVGAFAIVREAVEGFAPGDAFFSLPNGQITRRRADDEATAPFASLPAGTVIEDLTVDPFVSIGTSLIVTTRSGQIWEIDGAGKASPLADVGTPLTAAAVLPVDPVRFGPLAGTLIAAAPERGGVFSVDRGGRATFFALSRRITDVDRVLPSQNLFLLARSAGKLLQIAPAALGAEEGDLIATPDEGDAIVRLRWNGYGFDSEEIDVAIHADQALFAPADLSGTGSCVTGISATENVFQAEAGKGSVDVSAPPGCNWTAASDSDWLKIATGASGAGNGTVDYFVGKNVSNVLREGRITIDGFEHVVRQSRRAQLQCVQHFQPASVNLSAAGGVTDISIFSNDQCAWQATSDAPWISITGNVFGRGNGMVSIAGSTNFGGQSRRGFLVLPNGSVEINQAPNLAPNVNAGADQTVTLPNTIALSGSVSDDGIGNKPTVSWSQVSGPGTVIFGGAAGLQSSAIFNQAGIYLLRLTATDGYLTSNDDIQITVSDDPTPPPPDPSTVAPILDTTITTNISKSSVFLYTGPNPIQTGVDPINIKPERVGLVRGKVLGRNAQPITNAIITILDHPELGQTKSRSDGMFDLVVNGGGELTVKFEKLGYIASQREVSTKWLETTRLDDVVLIPFDGNASFIDLNSGLPIQVAESGIVTDADGSRRARLFFKQGTSATMTLPDNSVQSLSEMNVRSTEFTVGTSGRETMPAVLPATSEYTYASEYSVDEAVAVNATNVTFSQPVVQYLENYIGFPTGASVPTGSYDRKSSVWKSETSGRVVKILSVTGGAADLDLTGGGVPATDPEYAALGINPAERQKLAEIYTVGQTLWRVPISHFTPWDCNYPPANRPMPDVPPPFFEEEPEVDCDCNTEEETVHEYSQRQNVEETVISHQTGFHLIYDGQPQGAGAVIPLVGPTPPPDDLEQVAAIVTVAGQTTRSALMVPSANLSLNYTWDGKDFAGRTVQGPQTATVNVVHLYPIGYVLGGEFGEAGNGGGQTFVRTGAGITIRSFQIEIGRLDRSGMGLGGWSLSAHHVYDPATQTLYKGDGTVRHARSTSSVVNTSTGTGESGFEGDGGPAVNAKLSEPSDVAFLPDGTYYIADRLNNRVRRVGRDGIISTFAGDGADFCDPTAVCGDGGPAVNASVPNPVGIAAMPDGTVLVTDPFRNRIRKIDVNGIISTLAGNGNACDPLAACGDGGPAGAATLNTPSYLHLAQDGSIYVGDSGSQRVRKIGTNGIITTVAGSGNTDCPADNMPARTACIERPIGVALDGNGSLYITGNGQGNARLFRLATDGIVHVLASGDLCNGALQNPEGTLNPSLCDPRAVSIGPDDNPYFAADNRIYKFDSDGVLKSFIGTFDNGFNGEGQPVTTANFSTPAAATFGSDGNIYVAAAGDQRVRKVTPSLPGFSGTALLIPSEDGSEVFEFDADGRHLKTLNALTGTDKYVFGYNSGGLLVSVTDGDGDVTAIQRTPDGKPTGILSPYGQITALTLDSNGYIASITDPGGEAYHYTYSADGQMLSRRDPLNHERIYTYDAQGRLIAIENALGSTHTLSRTGNARDYTVTYNSPLDRVSTFQVQKSDNGDEAQVNTAADGTISHQNTTSDGSTSNLNPDGTGLQTTLGPDPRWGMQSPLEASSDVLTPAFLHSNFAQQRTVTVASPSNPLSLLTQTDTLNLNGRVFTSVFTSSNRTFEMTTPENRQSTVVVDGQERVSQAQFGGLNTANYTWDSHGKLSAAQFGSGAGARTYGFSYDSAGYLSTFTNALNQSISYVYDLSGRTTQMTLTDGRVRAFGYDANGNLTSLTPPGRPAHTFTYDALDRLTSYVAPNLGTGSSTTSYQYNADSDVARITRPDGLELNYAYDTGGRLQTVTVPNGSYGYSYDAVTGNLSNMTAPGGGTLAFQYDGFLPTRETSTGTVAGNVSQTFDDSFRVTSQSVNDASTVTFSYDNDNHLTAAGSLSLTRNAANGLLSGTALVNVTDTIIYNGFGETTNYNAKFNAATLYDASFTYSKLGRIVQKTESIGGTTSTYDYAYDAAGRLLSVTVDGAPQPLVTYGYDSNDNRTSINVGGNVITGAYDAQDRLTQFGNSTYAYTLNGELLSKTNAGQTTQYSYDVLGNLRQVILPDTTQIDYVIDPLDRRIGKKVDGTLTQGFLYGDQLEPVAELDGSNNVVSRFVYGSRTNVPDYMIKNGVTYRIIADQVGSVRLVVDAATGSVAQRIDYDEFGVVLLDTNPGFQPFGFAGGIYDSQTGLVRFGARDYDPETGRWTCKDLLQFEGNDTNLYSYSFADPLNSVDSDGLFPKSIKEAKRNFIEEVIQNIQKTLIDKAITIRRGQCVREIKQEQKPKTTVTKEKKSKKRKKHDDLADNHDVQVEADRQVQPYKDATKVGEKVGDALSGGQVQKGLENLLFDPGRAQHNLETWGRFFTTIPK